MHTQTDTCKHWRTHTHTHGRRSFKEKSSPTMFCLFPKPRAAIWLERRSKRASQVSLHKARLFVWGDSEWKKQSYLFYSLTSHCSLSLLGWCLSLTISIQVILHMFFFFLLPINNRFSKKKKSPSSLSPHVTPVSPSPLLTSSFPSSLPSPW